ncbi:MAG TPA: bifunctional (p)ppGpp synthetase/guanosine-3',5'-bis(diphosphate) 3'-pyrophosphohydrolase [Caldisericia bacterium]|nr:bifunctional (p)ppGpp synthetase/guanosine-3',5'-bis(diphosphate) 3'-pyrophosphohydrolase [Caldisericia bacterium]HPF49631.1 bifunctional (p)ppGpp synthetase/guanosine-3',5'-bis(diphosphate) 3'-pyrophosphohydrolase [Caldisericia bacterium]HPI82950.1 bifunctional (p)ppGpp synthetase/guanosine-3',5'-bis(diphosphate) 3'-pyrophosphohydrolase [Caldisericia bacterium]HPQ92177.1 bifunctional (p)ppGpp synthetase/guanosine-3',5'-bis(diphosphate) 3'-pyrophosphohydrolase [Caldisericia bacterium]HRV7472
MPAEGKSPFDLFMELVAKSAYLGDVSNELKKAYDIAVKYHEGQFRESGDPYVTHPLMVAILLTELKADLPTLQAAILHDTIEDTPLKASDVEELFGTEVLSLIDGVTKLSKVQFLSNKQQKLENTRKMLLAMASDIRVVLIKLADRLHNMQSIYIFHRKKQVRIAQDTVDIHVPLASRLGIYKFKWQLEDLSFRYLEPDLYKQLGRQVSLKRSERDSLIEEVSQQLSDILKEEGIKFEISGRAKNLFSIYKKMDREGKELDEIYDIHAVRVIVDDVSTCYRVLGLIHSRWKPLPGRIKDYIAVPKSNGYKSLHTTVIGPTGVPIEIQIRSWQMHGDAEYGIAAHWRYKEGKITFSKDYDQKLNWLRQLLEWQGEIKPTEDFVERVKTDLFSDEVLVFTPKGDIVNLPAGATPIDFAYRIHTEVGHSCTGAKVNDRIVPLSYRLNTGDRVKVMTSKHITGPSRDWLNFVAGHSTKARIRAWFKKSIEEQKPTPAEKETTPKPKQQRRPIKIGKIGAMIELEGIDNSPVLLARCCNPIYGDAIVGFITRGRGVSIHRQDCPNIRHLEHDSERFVKAEWLKEARKAFVVRLTCIVENRTGVLAKLSGILSEMGINIQMAKTTVVDTKRSRLIFAVEITSKNELNEVTSRLERVPEVMKVYRR